MLDLKRDKEFYEKFKLEEVNEKKLLEDPDLAVGLARYNLKFGECKFAQDLDILKLCDGKVVMWLAYCSDVNGWALTEAAQNLEVLKLAEGSVAWHLAGNSDKNGWGRTPAAQKMEILKLSDEEVAFKLAERSSENGWGRTKVAFDARVLKLYGGKVGEKLILHSAYNGWGDVLSGLKREGENIFEKEENSLCM